MAAATITLVGIPQCLAYAMMAGLPPAYGLVTAAIPGLVAALAGRSTQLVTGPTNTTGLLVLAAVTPWLADTGFVTTEGLTVVATLAVLAGLVRLGLAAVGGAALVRFLPESVLAGFTAGAGLLIGVMQLDEALGLPAISAGGLIDAVLGLGRDWTSGARPTTAAALVTAGTIGAILLVKKVRPKWPAALLGVVAAGLASAALGLSAETGLVLINERSPMPQGWPLIAMPSTDLSLWRELLVPACAIVLLGTLELAVTARADGARPSMRRELAAQGWANLVGAFTGAFPASASLTRSALLRMSGGQTRLAAALAALLCIPVLLFAGHIVGRLPQAALAGVLILTAWKMLDLPRLRRIWAAAPVTKVLLLVTLIATLTLPLELAVLLGVSLALGIHLAHTSEPHVRFLRPAGYALRPIGHAGPPLPTPLVVVEVSGELYYAAVESLREAVTDGLPAEARTVIMDISHAHESRFSVLLFLEALDRSVRQREGHLIVVGASTKFRALLQRTGSQLTTAAHHDEPDAALRICLAEHGAAPPWPPEG